jgi:hypothetical protein
MQGSIAQPGRVSGEHGQRDEGRGDPQVHARLEQSGSTWRDGQHRDHRGERGQQDPRGLEAEKQLPVGDDGHDRDRGDRQADAGHCRAVGRVEAALHVIGAGGVHRGDPLGHEDQHRDDHPDGGHRQPRLDDGSLHRGGDHLRQADHGVQGHQQQPEAQHG